MKFKFINNKEALPLTYPINFPVSVMGKDLIATITHLMNDPILNSFKIKFSDGYEDVFTLDEDGAIGSSDMSAGKQYAFVIKDDLYCLCLMDAEEKVWNFQYLINETIGNVWVRKTEHVYKIYTEGDYHFQVVKREGQWFSENVRKIEPRPIDEDLAKKVIAMLEKE